MRIKSPFIRALKPLAEQLLDQNPEGVTVDDLHQLGLEKGVIKFDASHHTLSALGHAFRAANGVNSGKKIPSKDEIKKGALQVVWVRSPYRA